jgi:hypothetical protein
VPLVSLHDETVNTFHHLYLTRTPIINDSLVQKLTQTSSTGKQTQVLKKRKKIIVNN